MPPAFWGLITLVSYSRTPKQPVRTGQWHHGARKEHSVSRSHERDARWREERWRSDARLRRLIAATMTTVVLVALTGACSSSRSSDGPRPSGKSVDGTITTAPPDPNKPVLDAYAAAQQAITDAVLHSDPSWPALFQTT